MLTRQEVKNPPRSCPNPRPALARGISRSTHAGPTPRGDKALLPLSSWSSSSTKPPRNFLCIFFFFLKTVKKKIFTKLIRVESRCLLLESPSGRSHEPPSVGGECEMTHPPTPRCVICLFPNGSKISDTFLCRKLLSH